MKQIITNNPEETKKLAQQVLADLGSNIIFLRGDLGSGKTVFVKGLAQALGVRDVVNSPTFVIMKIYETKNNKFKRLVHIDFYRLDEVVEADLVNLGIKEYMDDPESLVVIEWAERIVGQVPEVLVINFTVNSDSTRKIEF